MTKPEDQIADDRVAASADKIFYGIQDFAVGISRGVEFDISLLPPETKAWLPEYIVNAKQAAGLQKASVIATVLSNTLVQIFTPELLFGISGLVPMQAAQSIAATMKHADGLEFQQWLQLTRKLLLSLDCAAWEEAEAGLVKNILLSVHKAFGKSLDIRSKPAQEKKVAKAISTAVGLFRILHLAKASFHVQMEPVTEPNGRLRMFSSDIMSTIHSAEDEGLLADRPLFISVFPRIYKYGDELGENRDKMTLISKAKVVPQAGL